MALFDHNHPWVFAFGVLGNIASLMVYLVPVSTFYRIFKKKSTEEFQSFPYVVGLFSAMLWIYYATLKSNITLLLTINSFGCVMETIFLAIYIAYAPRKAKILTLKLVTGLNLVAFWAIIVLTHYLASGAGRVKALGWVCLVLNVSTFAAPLSIVAKVVRTKSVEFMPFWLSFFLTISAIMWFFYGILQKDYYIGLPNVLGFIFGLLQMLLYAVYNNCEKCTKNEKVTSNILDQITVITTIPNPSDEENQITNSKGKLCVENKLIDKELIENPKEPEKDQTKQQNRDIINDTACIQV